MATDLTTSAVLGTIALLIRGSTARADMLQLMARSEALALSTEDVKKIDDVENYVEVKFIGTSPAMLPQEVYLFRINIISISSAQQFCFCK